MLWLSWRQHRLQLLSLSLVLAIYAAFLVHLTLPMTDPTRLWHACLYGTSGPTCEQLNLPFKYVGANSTLNLTLALSNLLPALAGLFWGAPMISRELERGTHRLVWTQTVTRRRWLAAKLCLVATAALLAGGIQGALLTWATDTWLIIGTVNRFADPMLFDTAGLVPAALWVFAVVLGSSIGLLTRRTTTAMALTLAALAVVLVGLNLARPHYAAPVTRPTDQSVDPVQVSQEWDHGLRTQTVDGRIVPQQEVDRLCPPQAGRLTSECLADHGVQQVQVLQPANRYWRFQWTEAGILLAGAVLLAGATLAHLSRRPD